MTVLLTGGLGAIGSWALRALIERGERPVVLDSRSDLSLVSDLEGQFDLELGDILDPAVLYRVGYQYRVDRICHLAALMPPICQANPALGFRVNTQGVVALLELARALGVKRFVYTSSKAVYGLPDPPHGYPDYEPIPETYRFNPEDTYGVTKLAGELMVRQYGRIHGLDYVVLRLTSTYGPGKLERHGDVGLVSRVIEYAYRGEPVVVPSGGDERSDYVYNRDVGRAVVLAAFTERPLSRVYHIGTGRALSMHEVAEVVRSLVPGARIEIGPGVGLREGGKASGSILDTRRAAEELGFVAQYPFPEGARDYLRWLDQHAAPAAA